MLRDEFKFFECMSLVDQTVFDLMHQKQNAKNQYISTVATLSARVGLPICVVRESLRRLIRCGFIYVKRGSKNGGTHVFGFKPII